MTYQVDTPKRVRQVGWPDGSGRLTHRLPSPNVASGASVRGRDFAYIIVGVLLAALVAVVLGFDGSEVLAVVAAGAAVAILVRPVAGVLLFAASIPLQNLFMVGEGVTGTRVLGMAVFGAWIVNKLLRHESFSRIITSRFTLLASALVALAFASSLWARMPTATVAGGLQLLQMFFWALLVVDIAASWERTDMLVKALIVGGLIAAIVTIEQYFFGSLKRAGDEVAGGVNATSVMLVTLVPFGFYLFRSERTALWRACGFAYVAVAVIAITLTFSRMNMLLLPPLLAALSWETFRGGGGRGWLVTLLAAGCVAGALFVPWERVEERAQTIVPYLERTLGGGETFAQPSSGRGYHLKVGLAIARDHPVFGAGYRNYGHLFRDRYQFTVQGAGKVYGSARSPHSAHVGMLADLGLIGVVLWLGLLLGVGVRGVVKAWRATRQGRGSRPHLLVQALTYSLFLHVFAYGWYASTDQDKLFWALLGMSVVVAELTAARARRSPPRHV